MMDCGRNDGLGGGEGDIFGTFRRMWISISRLIIYKIFIS